MSLLEAFIATQVFSFLIIFARLGSAMMVMPGISDVTVAMEVRLCFALAFSFVLIPVLQPFLPAAPPTDPFTFALLIVKEIMTGLFMGVMSQIMMNAMNLAGVLVAHATSLSSAFTFNPQQASQTTVISGFFSFVIVTMFFVTDLHHLLFIGLINSYKVFPMDSGLLFGDMALGISQGVSDALKIGLMISAPFIIVSFGVFVGMGLVARLVPQIQVFIMSVPVQIMTGLILLMTSISAMTLYFLAEYEEFWKNFIEL
jgi:flagellar biosynthesis protein FliR